MKGIEKKEFERTFRAGLKWHSSTHGRYLKLMAVCDGYVMARYKGYMPFAESYDAFQKRLTTILIEN